MKGIALSVGMMILGLVSMHLSYVISESILSYETSNKALSEIDSIDFTYDNVEYNIINIVESYSSIAADVNDSTVIIGESLPNTKNPYNELKIYNEFVETFGQGISTGFVEKDPRVLRIIPGEITYKHYDNNIVIIKPEQVYFTGYKVEIILDNNFQGIQEKFVDLNSGENVGLDIKVRECVECSPSYSFNNLVDVESIRHYIIDTNETGDVEIKFLPGAAIEIKTSIAIDYQIKIVFPQEIIPYIRAVKESLSVSREKGKKIKQ